MRTNHRGDTRFIRTLHAAFHQCGLLLCSQTWLLLSLSFLAAAIGTAKIPLTRMHNDISDFTPDGALSRQEFEVYKSFFSESARPNSIYTFVTAKAGTLGDMLDVRRLNETIQLLDLISTKFYLSTPRGKQTYEQFCRAFCLVNEPVRHFFNGFSIARQFANNSGSHLDLGYPVTTALGMKMRLDPNFFGIKIAIPSPDGTGREIIVGLDELPTSYLNTEKQLPMNLRGVRLVVLQFRSELPEDVARDAVEKFEKDIVRFFSRDFSSHTISVTVFTDSFLTSEIVRSGLTLLPFLVIGFVIMVVFSAATFVVAAAMLKQMSFDKIVLAFFACACPFMACGAALGGMFWCGIRFGSLLCVTPFLVLAIGVDDAYLMVNSWQQITAERRRKGLRLADREAELRVRVCEMMVETGPSITITTITNVAAFSIGAYSSATEIQLFSVGNATAVIIDFIFTFTIYGAVMIVLGRREIAREQRADEVAGSMPEAILELKRKQEEEEEAATLLGRAKHALKRFFEKMLSLYCDALSSVSFCLGVLSLVLAYLVFAIFNTAHIKAELTPSKLFLEDSPFTTLFRERNEFITPFYTAAWIFVNNPGDVWDPAQSALLDQMVTDFESLPSSVGRYSTKYWLRDFNDFASQNEDLFFEFESDAEGGGGEAATGDFNVTDGLAEDVAKEEERRLRLHADRSDELEHFLSWPEFSFWRGFLAFSEHRVDGNGSIVDVPALTRFFFITAFRGSQLKEWSNRAKLLAEWRQVAAKYPLLNVTVYEEDNKFLDIIETMVPQSIQSALLTFASMFAVTLLFIPHPLILFTAAFSILSTSLGVFGIMSWLGSELDPIFMSAMVMSIGFSVDIPAHISYHYHQTAGHTSVVKDRLRQTIKRVGFPILQASLSTILCVGSLFAIDLHMATVFARTMMLVVVIGMLHGLLIIPVIFSVKAALSPRRRVVDITNRSTATLSTATLSARSITSVKV